MSEDDRPGWAVRIQHEREARGWGKWEMGRHLLNAVGIDPTPTRLRTLARQMLEWEKGHHFPRDWADPYSAAFDIPRDELFGSSNASYGESFLHGPDSEDEDVRRRTLLRMLATAAMTAPLGQESERLRTALHDAVDTSATDRDADAWERVAFDYAHEVGHVPTPLLLPDLLTDFEELSALISRSHDAVRTRLIHSAAQLAALTAIAFTNLGRARSARRWWRSAARAADSSGNHRTAALVRGRQAVFSLYEDRSPLSILDVAEEAISIGRNTPCAGVASGYAAKAQACAQLDRHQEAHETLGELHKLFERLPDEVTSDRSSQWGWSAQRLHHVASHVHTHAGDLARATPAQDQALALYPERNYQGRTQVELHRAGCLMRAGDVDEGARHTVQVLERLPSEFSSDGLLRRTAMLSL
uniref:hypothetical protein n=1 Tax=Actinomadura sp. SCN-SB TaxID=3373092 RepID=UPI0037537548